MAEEKGRVLLFGRRWSGRTTLANMLVSGEIGDCPVNPTDMDSICQTYVGRGWTVMDTMGFGDPLDDIAADEYATEMGINFLNEIRGSYSHIIFVLDGRELGGEPSPSTERFRSLTKSMWRTFLEIFRGGEERFVILITKVTPEERFTWPAWKRFCREVMETFPECQLLLWSNFFDARVGDDGEEAFVFDKGALEKLEKRMEEWCEGRLWVEPNIANMGDGEIKEMAARIIHQLSSTVKDDFDWGMIGSTYKIRAGGQGKGKGGGGGGGDTCCIGNPRPWLFMSSTFEATNMYAGVTCIGVGFPMQHSTRGGGGGGGREGSSQKKTLYRNVERLLKVRDAIENLKKKVKFYPQQCEYLFQRIKDAANEIHDLIYGNEINWDGYKNQHFQALNKSLLGVVSSMEVVKKLLHLCGEGMVGEVMLTMTSRIDSGRIFFTKFALVLRDLEWLLDVFRFWWHNVKADGLIEITQLPWRSKFSWCEARCRLVYVGGGENGVASAQFVECGRVVGDSERHAQDQQDLISSMENHFRNPKMVQTRRGHLSDIERLNYMSILRNRLQGNSTFQRPSCSSSVVPRCFQISGNLEYKSIRLIGQGASKEVSKCKWLGMNVALATFKNGQTAGLEAEAGMLATLQHPNVVTLIGYNYNEEKQQGFLVMELLEASLESLINYTMSKSYFRKKTYQFSIIETIKILLQIVGAMIHVHECGVVHRDLKPGNCLCNRGVGFCVDEVKLIDFGEAERGHEFTTANKGTPPYMAPEVYGRAEDPKGSLYTLSCDVYSFGMTCYQVITGKQPFGALRGSALRHKVCNGERPDIPSNCPHELKELMIECWAHIAED